MKSLLTFVFATFFSFILGFSVVHFKENGAKLIGKSALSTPFKKTPYPLQNKSFAVIVVGRNNGTSVEKTLRSIFTQNYENYRLIYVDDGSNDGSYEHAHDLIFESGYANKVQLMQSQTPQGVIGSLFQVIHGCEDHEIIVLLNEEDLLAHEWVLQKLNQYYANPDLWLTTGKYLNYPSLTSEPSNHFHLKTFYAGLFKKIEQKDLCFQNEFMPDSMDSAYMNPLLEMAKDHYHPIDDVLYLVTKSPDRDEILHALCENALKQRAPYTAQSSLKMRHP